MYPGGYEKQRPSSSLEYDHNGSALGMTVALSVTCGVGVKTSAAVVLECGGSFAQALNTMTAPMSVKHENLFMVFSSLPSRQVRPMLALMSCW
jgi:hypothetical protein